MKNRAWLIGGVIGVAWLVVTYVGELFFSPTCTQPEGICGGVTGFLNYPSVYPLFVLGHLDDVIPAPWTFVLVAALNFIYGAIIGWGIGKLFGKKSV